MREPLWLALGTGEGAIAHPGASYAAAAETHRHHQVTAVTVTVDGEAAL